MTSRTRQRGSDAAWTAAVLAHELGMSVRFIRGEIAEKQLKAVKIGREYRIPADEVERYCTQLGWPVPRAVRKES